MRPRAYRDRLREMEKPLEREPLTPDPDEVLPGVTGDDMTRASRLKPESILVPADTADEQAREDAAHPPKKITIINDRGNKMILPGACRHCGAMPSKPTRDGVHTCQCRMEVVKK